MVKSLTKERRNWSRAKRVLSIEYRLYRAPRRGPEEAWCLSTTQDISMGGLTFYSDQQYRIGDVLEIRVVMSGLLDIFKGLGEVTRVERKKMGAAYFVAVHFLHTASRQGRLPRGRGRMAGSKKLIRRV